MWLLIKGNHEKHLSTQKRRKAIDAVTGFLSKKDAWSWARGEPHRGASSEASPGKKKTLGDSVAAHRRHVTKEGPP